MCLWAWQLGVFQWITSGTVPANGSNPLMQNGSLLIKLVLVITADGFRGTLSGGRVTSQIHAPL